MKGERGKEKDKRKKETENFRRKWSFAPASFLGFKIISLFT